MLMPTVRPEPTPSVPSAGHRVMKPRVGVLGAVLQLLPRGQSLLLNGVQVLDARWVVGYAVGPCDGERGTVLGGRT